MADPTGVHLAPSSLRDLRQLGEAYRGGDKVLRKGIRDGLTRAAKPLALAVVREGASKMPKRGGLAARIAASKGAVTSSFTARGAAVSIRLSNAQKDSLGGLDQGAVRHPVFRTGTWVTQSVPANAFSDAFDRDAPIVRVAVEKAVEDALEEIARDAS